MIIAALPPPTTTTTSSPSASSPLRLALSFLEQDSAGDPFRYSCAPDADVNESIDPLDASFPSPALFCRNDDGTLSSLATTTTTTQQHNPKGPPLQLVTSWSQVSPATAAAARQRSPVRRLFSSFSSDDSIMSPDSAPNSPPELSNSKSSKASSFPSSSSFSDRDEFSADISHFEDITLEEQPQSKVLARVRAQGRRPRQLAGSTGRPADVRPALRSATLPIQPGSFNHGSGFARPNGLAVGGSGSGNGNGTLRPSRSLRDLNSHQKSPVLDSHSRSGFLNPPNARSLRRPPVKSLPLHSSFGPKPPSPRRPRSPLNDQSRYFASPTRSLSPASSHSSRGTSPATLPIRAQSTQPRHRKTAKEIEDEYDSDEDVPEDAFIWNVPLSPRPMGDRVPSVSPERRTPAMPCDHEATLSAKSPRPDSGQRSFSDTPTSPNFGRRVSASDIGPEPLSHRHRTKSWTAALSDLSEEARVLTEVLEAHAETSDQSLVGKQQKSVSASTGTLERAKTAPSSIELPPVRKGNIMIDPLPISREKEKVLTRTRPSWLPPKDPKEEKKHLKEYQKMMAYSQEAERRRSAKLLGDKDRNDVARQSVSHIWENHVLPNWAEVIHEPQIRQLWWLGLPAEKRGVIWVRAIGNDLGLSEKSYLAALRRAVDLNDTLAKLDSEERAKHKEWAWLEAIRRDVGRTYPELGVFQTGGSAHRQLLDLLMAYAMYRSDVGYVYGTHLVAALLVRNIPEPSTAFIALANLFNRPLPMTFLVHDAGAMDRVYDLVLKTLRYKIPKLHAHLTSVLSLGPAEYLDPMFRTLFCDRGGIEVASRIWDVYLFEGDKALIRAAVGSLAALEGRLYGSRDEVLDVLSWSGGASGRWDAVSADDFMKAVRSAGKVDA